MDYQWGNQNILFIIDKNNIIDRKTDQKALKDYWNLLISKVSDGRHAHVDNALEEG